MTIGLRYKPQLFPGNDFQQFFESAASARKSDHGIRKISHSLFALMHTVDFDRIGKPLVTPILFYHKTRDHTVTVPPGSQRSIRHGNTSGPNCQPLLITLQVPFAQQMSQLGRSLPICRSDLRAGGTIHANGSYLISFSFHLSFLHYDFKTKEIQQAINRNHRTQRLQNHLFSLYLYHIRTRRNRPGKDHPGRYATGPRLSQAPFSGVAVRCCVKPSSSEIW